VKLFSGPEYIGGRSGKTRILILKRLRGQFGLLYYHVVASDPKKAPGPVLDFSTTQTVLPALLKVLSPVLTRILQFCWQVLLD
jgi:hypothetical protein